LIRINRFLAEAGLGSRRRCEELVRRGSVFVNGRRLEKLSIKIDPDQDVVTVDGIRISRAKRRLILALNKPTGVLSSTSDIHERKTVIDLAKENGYPERLFPVGRLDLETSGILILTNDGEFAFHLTHPRFKIEKTYNVTVEGKIGKENISRLASGIRLEDFETQPCEVRSIEELEGFTELVVKLKEGKKRQIRKMFEAVGNKVIRLHRSSIGGLSFSDLEIGMIRPLSASEERRLRELSGLI